MAKPVSSKQEIANVGAISANNDMTIGDLLADALEKRRQGRCDHGRRRQDGRHDGRVSWMGCSSTRATSRPTSSTSLRIWIASWKTRLILIFEKKISNLRDLVPMLEKVSQTTKPLLIIAEDVDAEALTLLVVNKLRGTC